MTKKYVTEYKGHKVPEGATHYYDCDVNGLQFYKMRKGEVYSCDDHADDWIFCADGGFFSYSVHLPEATEQDLPNWDEAPEWADRLMEYKAFKYWCNVSHYSEVGFNKISGSKEKFTVNSMFTIGDFDLIEIRPVEDKAEWDGKGLPPVGCTCQGLFINDELDSSVYLEVKILYIFAEECAVMRLDTHQLEYCTYFMPAKTQEEKKREAFIEASYVNSKASRNSYTAHIFRDMFNAGFTTPKEGE